MICAFSCPVPSPFPAVPADEAPGREGDSEEDPASAEPIARTEVFEVEPLSEDVYAVTTDAGRTILHLEHLAAADGAGGDDQ